MRSPNPRRHVDRLLAAYYWATPVFAVLDVGLGVPLRAAGLGAPAHRLMYYAALVALAGLCRVVPRALPWVGMTESAFNLLLLVLAIMIPVFNLPAAAAAGGPLEGPFDRVSLANALMSGTAFTLSFYRHQAVAGR